jgi:DNA-binding response OmpR family regulator
MSEYDSSTASRRRVLSVGRDPDLLRTRELVLRSAAFEVVTAATESVLNDALHELEREASFQACVLCQTVPLSERVDIAARIREVAPHTGVIFLHYPGESFDARSCDALVSSPIEPDKLLAAVRRAIQRASQRAQS